MRRSLLPLSLILATIAVLPRAAEAAVVSTVTADTLTITGDAAADRLTLRLAPGAPGTLAGRHRRAPTSRSTARPSRRSRSARAPAADDIRIDESNGDLHRPEATTIESGAGADLVRRRPRRRGDRRRRRQRPRARRRRRRRAVPRRAATTPRSRARTTAPTSSRARAASTPLQTVRHGRVRGVHRAGRRRRASASAATWAWPRTDMAGIESPSSTPRGGPDLVDVGDLSGTELTRVDADLGLADGARDTVFAAGSDGDRLDRRVVAGRHRSASPACSAEVRLRERRSRPTTASRFRPAAAPTS